MCSQKANGLRMRVVDPNEAEQLLDQWLDEVERGETVRILRGGKPIARLTPDADARGAEAAKAIKAPHARREQFGEAPSIHEGHKS
jgi:antitoxin (DNA-binding transcriptional repressor) of toxin-antitoxin stability system